MMKNDLTGHDYELISAYLDHEMALIDRARFEERMEEQPALIKAIADLRETRRLIRTMPVFKAPRSFVLKPGTAGVRPGALMRFLAAFQVRSLQYGAAISALLLILVFSGDFLTQTRPESGISVNEMSAVSEIPAAVLPAAAPLAQATSAAPAVQTQLDTAMEKSLAKDQAPAGTEMQAFSAEAPAADSATLPEAPSMAAPAAAAPAAESAEAGKRIVAPTPGALPTETLVMPALPAVQGAQVQEAAPEMLAEQAEPEARNEKPPARWGWRLIELLIGAGLIFFASAAWAVSRWEARRR